MRTRGSESSEHPKRKGGLFASDPDPWHNAYLEHVPMAWCLYADGYRKAAALLVERRETFYDRSLLGADVDLERDFRHDVYPEP